MCGPIRLRFLALILQDACSVAVLISPAVGGIPSHWYPALDDLADLKMQYHDAPRPALLLNPRPFPKQPSSFINGI